MERPAEHSSLTQDRYYNLYGRQIVRRYRPAAIEKFGQEYFSASSHYGAPVYVEGRTEELPSWWEFVQWIIDTAHDVRDLDEHWRPIRDNFNLLRFES